MSVLRLECRYVNVSPRTLPATVVVSEHSIAGLDVLGSLCPHASRRDASPLPKLIHRDRGHNDHAEKNILDRIA